MRFLIVSIALRTTLIVVGCQPSWMPILSVYGWPSMERGRSDSGGKSEPFEIQGKLHIDELLIIGDWRRSLPRFLPQWKSRLDPFWISMIIMGSFSAGALPAFSLGRAMTPCRATAASLCRASDVPLGGTREPRCEALPLETPRIVTPQPLAGIGGF
jgi:hypothetical protein